MALRVGYLDLSPNLWVAAEMAPFVEALGFTRYWFTEHPPQPSPIILASLAGKTTSRIRVGTTGVLLNLHNVFQVAQDFRFAGALLEGRFDAGFCAGITPYEPVLRALLDLTKEPKKSFLMRAFLGKNSDLTKEPKKSFELRAESLVGFLRGELKADDPLSSIGHLTEPCDAKPWILGTGPTSAKLAARLGTSYGYSLFHPFSKDSRDSMDLYRSGIPQQLDTILAVSFASSTRPIEKGMLVSDHWEVGPVENIVGEPSRCRDMLFNLAERYAVNELVVLDLFLEERDRKESMELLSKMVGA